MAWPPGFLDDLRSRLTLSDIAGRKVIWDARKSNPAKGDFWAPCPFHQEKTASFHVDDRKGFYYCFGCHAKGDMISFVKDTDNLGFVEAVELLAREAGVEMPRQTRDPQAAQRRERADILAQVMETAVQAFGLSFRSAQGTAVRDYTRQRGLTDQTLKQFEIGYAPDNRMHLTNLFREKNLLDEAIATGMIIKPDDGGAPYDRFRGRLMFPIRDGRGRCIAFGGRAMSPNARAKYLNSPETELFHKGRTLYNQGPAREAAGKTQSLIVAEGYMDVIALSQAGFTQAVAPLGTAITEEQLKLMWRITDEPVIALDGDAAGQRAAEKLVDLALPMLAPGKSLRFCLMPEGRDPDDLIKAEGPKAMQDKLEAAVPLIDILWRRETAAGATDTPERRAALDQSLKRALGQITDAGVRNHYAAELRARRADLFRPRTPAQSGPAQQGRQPFRGRPGAQRGPAMPARETLTSDLARQQSDNAAAARIHESTILLIVLHNPETIGDVEEMLEAMDFADPRGAPALINAAVLDLAPNTEPADLVTAITERLGEDPVARLASVPQARANPFSRPGQDRAKVIEVLRESLTRHCALRAHSVEIAEARRDLQDAEDESWSVRVLQANQERYLADIAATQDDETSEGEAESVFQRMLDNGTWRRAGS